jgi:8-oxo-dGTP pyrophosphatase MutT (NUDIX family)
MTPALNSEISTVLDDYEQRHGTPSGPVELLREALAEERSVSNRKDFPVHVTCGVIAINPDGRVLQIHHRALDRWLFPGGHLETDDATLLDAAQRELTEETGLTINPTGHVAPTVIDIDIHQIPANANKSEPAHHHADFRYLVGVTDTDVRLQEDEVTAWRWTHPDELDNSILAKRIAGVTAM